MAAPMNVRLPPFFTLSDGMQLRVTAIDATTGATVAGVVISDIQLSVDPVAPPEPDFALPGTIELLPGAAA